MAHDSATTRSSTSYRRITGCLLFITLFMPQYTTATGDPVAGEIKAEICTECHSIDGDTPDPMVPKLNGQYEDFLFKQTMLYITGKRSDTVMGKVMNKVKPSREDIADISTYYSRLPLMTGTKDTNDTITRGRDIFYNQKCNFCHNDADRSQQIYIFKTSIIGGQNKEYLYKSLKDIQEGIRTADSYNLMQRVLLQMPDDDINAVSEFLSSL